jgi:transmembrane sensor
MNELEKKYCQNKLNPAELKKLQQQLSSSSDEQISLMMQTSWMTDEIDVTKVEESDVDRIKNNIDNTIGSKKSARHLFMRISQIAAAILLPLFILSTLYLYQKDNRQKAETMVVSTAQGEHANISLPDGTKVMMNSDSRLSYTPTTFNLETRSISFDGEAYFQVHKDKSHPFIIHAKGLDIKVLGTKFNLLARSKDATAELTLEEGSVSLTAVQTGEEVILSPNDKAIFDRKAGDITVIQKSSIEDATAWKRKELVFRNCSFYNVLRTIEKTYNVKITTKCKYYLPDLFTGTIPSSDLNEAIKILEKSYDLKGHISDHKITLTTQK